MCNTYLPNVRSIIITGRMHFIVMLKKYANKDLHTISIHKIPWDRYVRSETATAGRRKYNISTSHTNYTDTAVPT